MHITNYSSRRVQKGIVACGFLFAALYLSGASHMALAKGTTTVYFIPFEVETYIPVTPATIAGQAWEKWTISSKQDNDRILAILNHGQEGAFDQNRVRALVIVGQKHYFIDTNGTVQTRGSEGLTIHKTAFMKFRDQLRAGQRLVLRREK